MNKTHRFRITTDSAAISTYLHQVLNMMGGQAASVEVNAKKNNSFSEICAFTEDKQVDGAGIALKTPVRAHQLIQKLCATTLQRGKPSAIMRFSAGSVDIDQYLWLPVGGDALRLTEKETALIAYLGERRGQMVGRQELLEKIWSYADGVETHTLETHIYRLRQKIEADPARPETIMTAEEGYFIPDQQVDKE